MGFPRGIFGQRWITVANTLAEAIPPFAAMRITDVGTGTGLHGDMIYYVAKPDASTDAIMFNGDRTIPAKSGSVYGYGVGTLDFPCVALCDITSGQPSQGELWGPTSGSWKLTESTFRGYRIANHCNADPTITSDASEETAAIVPDTEWLGVAFGLTHDLYSSISSTGSYNLGVDSWSFSGDTYFTEDAGNQRIKCVIPGRYMWMTSLYLSASDHTMNVTVSGGAETVSVAYTYSAIALTQSVPSGGIASVGQAHLIKPAYSTALVVFGLADFAVDDYLSWTLSVTGSVPTSVSVSSAKSIFRRISQ